jgi:DNA-binding MarR family transcriptional regulator
VTKRALPFDPIEAAGHHWEARRWPAQRPMAAATSIMRVQQLILAAVDLALADIGLTFARYEALVLLTFSRHGALPMGKMGERLMIHPTSVTNVVDRLEAQGLVRRIPHGKDRRVTLVELTRDGATLVTTATQLVVAIDFGIVGLSADELRTLISMLRKVRFASGDFDESKSAT